MKRAGVLIILALLCGVALWGQITLTPGPLGNGIVGTGYEGLSIVPQGCGQPGENSCTWSVSSGALPPGLGLAPGCAFGACWLGLTGTPTTAGDFTYTITADSTDTVTQAPITGSQTYTMVIYGMSVPAAISWVEGVPFNQEFSVEFSNPSIASYQWALLAGTLPPGLTSPPLTLSLLSYPALAVSGTPTAPGIYPMTVELIVNDSFAGTLAETQTFNVAIAPSAPVTATALGNLTLGVPVAADLGAAGGFGPGTYTFSYTGTLPPGVTLSADGSLTGSPTMVGVYTFTVQLASTPAAGYPPLTATATFTITVYPTFTITGLPAATAAVGAAYSQPFAASGGGGAGTYTWTVASGTLPPGLTLSGTGVLSGTPTSAGTFNSLIQAISQVPTVGAMTATSAFTMTVTGAAASAITGSLPNGTVGTPYSATLGAVGGFGAGTYTYSLASGNLPAGTNLSPAGTLSGTPTAAGTGTFTVQVTSTNASLATLTATQSFTVTIYPALAIATGTAIAGTVGVTYSQAFAASGGAGLSSYTWSVAAGAPPTGLSLSAAGVLSGTPAVAGTFPFTLQVSSTIPGGGVVTAAAPFSIAIAPASGLAITGSLPGDPVGMPYSATLGATGGYGAGTYTFAVASGTLPAGTELSPGGTLSGTPSAAGTFTFVVQVTSTTTYPAANLPPLTATESLTVVIYPTLAISPQIPGAGMVGTLYVATLIASGGYGTAAYTFSLASGALPPGIQLSTGGTLSGTPSAAGATTFTVQASSKNAGLPTLTATQSFTVAIYPALGFTPQTLNPGTVGTQWAQGFNPTGGYGEGTYSYSLVSGTLPPGITMNFIPSGTPTAAGTFSFAIQLANGPVVTSPGLPTFTVTQSYTLVIYPALAIAPQSLGPATVDSAYSATLVGTGGYGPGTNSFTMASGALPSGMTLSPGGVLSGTPMAPGTFQFTAQVSSSETGVNAILPAETATQSFTLVVGLPAAPPVEISGLPASPEPATQPVLGLSVASVYPLDIQGTITLAFAPDSGADDPNVQFTTGGRTVTFQILANSIQAQFATTPGVQTGTVAGAITLTLDLTADGIDITPTPAPTQVLVVPPRPPAITSATIAPVSDGFNLVIVGYATTRDMTSAAIVFTPASGVTLSSSSATVPLNQGFTTWYRSSASAQYGSQFSLEIPFTVQSATAPIASLSITLTNSQGTSAPAVAAY